MHRKHLGDSFDVVKRFWGDRLAAIAPLFAHPRFVPKDIRPEFQKMVNIPVLDFSKAAVKPFGLFPLDPDTGIPLPTSSAQKATTAHAPVPFIAAELERLTPEYLICFDQSHDRNCGLPKLDQRRAKLEALRGLGIFSFYYVSHAPFLFAASDASILECVRRRVLESGIPEWRLERADSVELT